MKRTMPTVPQIRAALADTPPGVAEALKPKEADVKRAVCEWLTRFGYQWTRVQSGSIFAGYKGRVHRVDCAEPGTADILVILPPNGYALWLEIKSERKGSKPSPEQIKFAETMARLGAGYRIVRSIDQLVSAMREEVENAKVRKP